MSDQTRAAVIGIIPRLIWPLLLVVVIAAFHGPLARAIERAGSGGGAEVSVGILRISIPKSELPVPPVDVERVMPQLDSGMRQFIVANVGGQNTPDNCYQDAGLREFQDGSATQSLARKGLITFTPKTVPDAGGRPCLGGARVTYTPLYDQVRNYLLAVMLAVDFRER